MKEIKINKSELNQIFTLQENEEIIYLLEDKNEESWDFKIKINLLWANSKAFLKGRVFANWNTKKIFDLRITAHWRNQEIWIDLKWVADWNSFISFNWGAVIWPKSTWANVDVLQKIILFSDKARGSTIPVLDVKTDQLSSASHSASISPFEKEKLFYLETRWVAEPEAKKLLVEAFLNF